MINNLNSMYFSATDTTKKIVTTIVQTISKNFDGGLTYNNIEFTLPEIRLRPMAFSEKDMVIIGVPVYAGRVPNVLLNYLNTVKGNGALAIPVVVYGNRNYDDALIELKDILIDNGFIVIAGGAFIGEHAFSRTLGKNRPDVKDIEVAKDFANQISNKLKNNFGFENVIVKGNQPYRKYYMPKDKDGNPVDIRKVTPKTNLQCIKCKLCVKVCPMGSIDYEDVSKLTGICIKCGACIKKCPSQAKYYDDENYLRHKEELEIEYAFRREPELFL